MVGPSQLIIMHSAERLVVTLGPHADVAWHAQSQTIGEGDKLLLQAIARSHRIGQTKEVRVIHFEAVVDADKPGTSQQEQQDGQV